MRGCTTVRIIVLGVICLVVQTSSAVAAPVQWTTTSGGNGHYYEFKDAYLISWADAKEAAQVPLEVEPGHIEIGYLVTITSAAENDFINTALNTGSADSYAWTGGHEPNDEGPWFWATGPEAGVLFSIEATPTPPFHFANWGPFEPNDSHGREDYCGINLGLQHSSNPPGYWADLESPPQLPWNPVAGYVVEWTPEPASLTLLAAGLLFITGRRRQRNPYGAALMGRASGARAALALGMSLWNTRRRIPMSPFCRVLCRSATFAAFLATCTALASEQPPVGLLVGDADGNVSLRAISNNTILNARHLADAPIGRVDVLDLDGDGTSEFLATHRKSLSTPTWALDLMSFNQRWHTDHNTSFTGTSLESIGVRHWSGDFDGDGTLELVIPYAPADTCTLHVFSADNGALEATIPQTGNFLATVYLDPVDSHYKLITQNAPDGFTHYARAYDLSDYSVAWENTAVNTWKQGAIGSSMIDGMPRVWGGWYDRTMSVLDREGNELWRESFGGDYEVEGFYAGDLRGDGVECLLVGGTYGGDQVRLDAADLATGTTLWTFDDLNADWALHVLATEDVNGDGVKEVFADTGGASARKLLAISGADGTLIWEQSYPLPDIFMDHARFADVDEDGDLDVLWAIDNRIEARDALTGTLVRTFEFDYDVTSFELAAIPEPATLALLFLGGIMTCGRRR